MFGGLGGALRVGLQVDVGLHRVDTAHTALLGGSLEDTNVTRHHEPEVRPARFLAEAEARAKPVAQGAV
ncbi:MAG: hypothetical protein KIT72_07540 [Polyangiaceae bacterium]|nr:hypothetical protein [Polyangiaceae bacterium]